MKKLMIPSAVLCLVFLAVCAGRAFCDGTPAAMIVKVNGDVKVQRGGKQKAITTKFALLLGDKVVVAPKSSALILFANGKKVTAISSMEITQAAAALDGKKVSPGAGAAGMLMNSVAGSKNADLKAKGGVAGAVRSAGDKANVELLSYLNTSTTNTRPVFAWQPSANADGSKVSLMNEDGDVLWSQQTKDKIAAYPEDKAPLSKGGEYTVEVTSTIDGEDVSSSSTFYELNANEAKSVADTVKSIKNEYSKDDDLIIQHMLLAQYYKQKELYMDAIDELKKLIALDKYDVTSIMTLAQIYDTIGDKAAFKATMAQEQAAEKELGDTTKF